jgi:hypothetical protein
VTPAEAADLLSLAATFDSRKPDVARAHAWADALEGLTFGDCARAIRMHYRESEDFIMPAHVIRRARTYMLDRREQQQVEEHLAIMAQPANPNGAKMLEAGLAKVGNEPPPPPKGDRANECPWCKAKPGRGCVTPVTNRPISGVHPSRLEVA